MNKFRKAVAFLLALTCIGGTGLTMGASAEDVGVVTPEEAEVVQATKEDPCDLDGNGSVDISDVILLNRYLLAKYPKYNYNEFDVNQNMVVDAEDSRYIQAKIVGNPHSITFYSRKENKTYPAPTISGATLDAYAKRTDDCEYRRYSYDSGNYTAVYWLTPPKESNVTQAQNGLNSVVDPPDDRVYGGNLEESSGIVKVGGGTGFIVGDHVIATAAHCVYDEKNSKMINKTGISVYLYDKKDANNNFVPGTELTLVEGHIPIDYTSSTRRDETNDYALITVKEDLSQYYHFKLGNSYNVNPTNWKNVPIYVTGCPGALGEDGEYLNSSHYLYTAEGRISQTDNTSLLHYNTNTSPGDSGSPVYVITRSTVGNQTTDQATVLAIHAYAGNYGALITKYQQQFYLDNPHISY